MKLFSSIAVILLALNLPAQILQDHWANDDLDRMKLEHVESESILDFHASVRPYAVSLPSDTSWGALTNRFRYALSTKTLVSPIIEFGAGLEATDEPTVNGHQTTAGLRVSQSFGEKLSLHADIFGTVSGMNDLTDSILVLSEVLPGLVRAQGGENDTKYGVGIVGSLSFSPSQIFEVSAGRGKHFFGHGYRSLLLSDNANPNPFLKLDTKVWKLRYINLFSQQKGVLDIFDPMAQFENKYTASHYLSWRVSSRFDVSLFESIVWQGQDFQSDRGFDLNYLNPVIFYRPVEFATGSADNAIIGMGMSYREPSGWRIYSQLALDEFLLTELRKGDGWWGNKFAVQVGMKSFNALGIKDLYLQGEFNLARPFTYSHGSPLQSYSHYNEPLAHPLGANYYEGVLIGLKKYGKWEFRNQSMYRQYGRDAGAGNFGGDILRSYVDPSRQFGNYIGQGMRTEVVSNEVRCSYLLDTHLDFRAQLAYRYEHIFGELPSHNLHGLSFALRMNFRDSYR